ncbi:MAG: DNA-3-methyladenine glycosylase family protein [Alphaproteobacteria bacterium]
MHAIRNASDLASAVSALVALDARFGALAAAAVPLPLRLSRPGFKSLIGIVVNQQISRSAADAIFARLEAIVVPFEAGIWLATKEATLGGAGLSAPKLRHARAIAQRVHDGRLNLDELCCRDDDEVRAELMNAPGIGRWTADIYLLTCLGRTDAWPAGDLALQAATANFLRKRMPLSLRQMETVSQEWRPWRSAAARLLWAHYRRLKTKEAA